MHQELLAIARELAGRDGGRPRKESLARAISTAYYALFHALAEFCGRELVGAWAPWPPFRLIYRSLDHAAARRVFEIARTTAGTSDDVRRLGEIFRLLQKLRHDADYDPGFRTTRRETEDLIEQAESAIQLLGRLDVSERKLLAARLIGRTRPS
ncbi:HEPN domain-containing protein [Methylobacterium sp. A54F]